MSQAHRLLGLLVLLAWLGSTQGSGFAPTLASLGPIGHALAHHGDAAEPHTHGHAHCHTHTHSHGGHSQSHDEAERAHHGDPSDCCCRDHHHHHPAEGDKTVLPRPWSPTAQVAIADVGPPSWIGLNLAELERSEPDARARGRPPDHLDHLRTFVLLT